MVKWSGVEGETLPVLGYKLYANAGRNDDLRLIYDGSSNAQITQFDFDAESN